MDAWQRLLDGEAEEWRLLLREEFGENEMKIIEVRYSAVEIEDEHGYRSDVFKQGDGKWKCLRCQRYRCEHARWVAQQNPILPELPPLSAEDIDDILTY